MSKPKVAFIDHPFHRSTKSSHFFTRLLTDDFDVHTFYVEPDPRATMQEIADAGYELVVCWQTEYCAPYFLMRGMRVVCVPMYDGVAGVPDWYWLPMRQARFISFSTVLHERLRSLGIESYYFRYFADDSNHPELDFSSLRLSFWQRRPEDGLNYRFVRRLFGTTVDRFHIHNAPDVVPAEDWEPGVEYVVTHFDENGSSYKRELGASNIFVAPRYTEGIGMAMIEAMARGMCIVAHNEPTANEYIIHGVNGLLIDYRNVQPFTGASGEVEAASALTQGLARRLGSAAKQSYVTGRVEWLESSKAIPFLVATAPRADLSDRNRQLARDYLSICRHAFANFNRYLSGLASLQRRGLSGIEHSALSLRERLRLQLRLVPGAHLAWRLIRRFVR